MIVMPGVLAMWLVSSKLRNDSRALGTIPWMEPGINGLDGLLVEKVQAALLQLLV